MLNLSFLLEDSAREVPERTAVIFENTKLSYAELNAAANQVANALVQAGIRKGDTVARMSPPSRLRTMASSKQEPWSCLSMCCLSPVRSSIICKTRTPKPISVRKGVRTSHRRNGVHGLPGGPELHTTS